MPNSSTKKPVASGRPAGLFTWIAIGVVLVVVAALVSAADAKVGQAVSAGTLTSAQGQKIEVKLPAFVTKVVNKVH